MKRRRRRRTLILPAFGKSGKLPKMIQNWGRVWMTKRALGLNLTFSADLSPRKGNFDEV